jgi:acetyltransferase-like isoleucine patch superfamily enzyme
MRPLARMLRNAWRQLRFQAWIVRARLELRRCGGRLRIEAPHGARFDSSPAIKSIPEGSGSGTLTLRIGRDVWLGRKMTIEVWARGDNVLEIGDRTRFLDGVRIALRSGAVRFGPNCLIRDGVWIKSDGDLVAGDEVTLSHHSAVHCTGRIELEDLVGIGDRACVLDSDHNFDGSDEHYMSRPVQVSPVRIGRNTMVAVGAVVLRGARIGPNSVVSSNAVVRAGEYPRASVLSGNPAEVLKVLSSDSGDSQQPDALSPSQPGAGPPSPAGSP